MIPGLKEYVETGNVKAIEQFLQVETDDYKMLIETAYELIRDAAHEGEEWNELAKDWLAVAGEVLYK